LETALAARWLYLLGSPAAGHGGVEVGGYAVDVAEGLGVVLGHGVEVVDGVFLGLLLGYDHALLPV
jgi:hypothetical protein